MRKNKTPLTIPSFGYTYVLLDRRSGVSYSFDTISQAVRFVSKPRCAKDALALFSLSSKLIPLSVLSIVSSEYKKGTRPSSTFGGHRLPPYHLSNHLGSPVPLEDIAQELALYDKEPSYAWVYRNRPQTKEELRQQRLDERLVGKKNSPRKIKTNHQKSWGSSYWSGNLHLRNNKVGCYRHIKTRAETRWNEAHSDPEFYEYGCLVRPGRQKLPNVWDDIMVSLHKTEKSWKHHSKRKKQWIPK